MIRNILLAALIAFAAASIADAAERDWLRAWGWRYHDPANYPGRAVYAGSRFGFYGYERPLMRSGRGIPPAMLPTAAPTMYHYRRSITPRLP